MNNLYLKYKITPYSRGAPAQEGSTFFGSFFPDGKKEHKQRQSVAVAYGERRTFSGTAEGVRHPSPSFVA